jgi:hypothetical protein
LEKEEDEEEVHAETGEEAEEEEEERDGEAEAEAEEGGAECSNGRPNHGITFLRVSFSKNLAISSRVYLLEKWINTKRVSGFAARELESWMENMPPHEQATT